MNTSALKSDAIWHVVSGHSSATTGEHAPVQVCLLGSPRILVGGKSATHRVKHRKGIALLSLLAIESDIKHPRERIANLFWPDLERTSALTNLRQVISNLARALTPAGGDAASVLATDSSHVGLFANPNLSIDVHALRASADRSDGGGGIDNTSAMQPPLHRFLEGFDLPDCLEYSSWIELQREKLDQDIICLHERAITRAMARQDLESGLLHARLIERINPLLEDNQVRLMRLLVEKGRPKQALVQFERFARLLREELDVEPEPATQALHQHIMKRASTVDDRTAGLELHLDEAKNTTAMFVTCDAEPGEVDEQVSIEPALQIQKILRQYSHRVVDSHGLGQFAYFDTRHEGTSHGHAAIQAAVTVMTQLHCAALVRIGIFSDQIPADDDLRHAFTHARTTELARRLGFIADGGDIIVCADTLGSLDLDVEYLGEWRFRGIERKVHAFRLDRT